MMANKITPISETDRNALKRKTAATLPDNPAAHGMKAAAVKPKFWQALVDGEESVAGLIDRVVREANEALGKTVERVAYSADTEKITLTFGDGSTEVLDCPKQGPVGAPGRDGVSPTVLTEPAEGGYRITVTDVNGVNTFFLPQGAKGATGDPFRIAKTYTSVAQMHAGFAGDNVPEGGFVLIATGSVENADNAKLFVKGTEAYQYLIDLSGATGIKGEQGVGVRSITKTGSAGLTDTYTVTLTDGSTYTYTVTNGRDGEDGKDGADGAPGADGADGADGAPGKDGVSPTVSVTKTTTGHTVKITDASGTKSFAVANGTDGKDGTNGRDGVDGKGISVHATSTDGIHYVATIEGMTAYYEGLFLLFETDVPSSSTQCYLSINGLEECPIRCIDLNSVSRVGYPKSSYWLYAGVPLMLTYSTSNLSTTPFFLSSYTENPVQKDTVWVVDRSRNISVGYGTAYVVMRGIVNQTEGIFQCTGSVVLVNTTNANAYTVIPNSDLQNLLRQNDSNIPTVTSCTGTWWGDLAVDSSDVWGYGAKVGWSAASGDGISFGRAYQTTESSFGGWSVSYLKGTFKCSTIFFSISGTIAVQ